MQYPLQVWETVNVIELAKFIDVKYEDVAFIFKLKEKADSVVTVSMPVVESKLTGEAPVYGVPFEL